MPMQGGLGMGPPVQSPPGTMPPLGGAMMGQGPPQGQSHGQPQGFPQSNQDLGSQSNFGLGGAPPSQSQFGSPPLSTISNSYGGFDPNMSGSAPPPSPQFMGNPNAGLGMAQSNSMASGLTQPPGTQEPSNAMYGAPPQQVGYSSNSVGGNPETQFGAQSISGASVSSGFGLTAPAPGPPSAPPAQGVQPLPNANSFQQGHPSMSAGPPNSQSYGVSSSNSYADPWGAPAAAPSAPPPSDPSISALVPSQQQANPYALPGYGSPPPQTQEQQLPPQQQYQQQQPPQQQYQQQQPPQNPYGAPNPAQTQQQMVSYGGPAAADPFSVFEAGPAPAPQQQPVAPVAPPGGGQLVAAQPAPGDIWGDLGFDAAPGSQPTPAQAPQPAEIEHPTQAPANPAVVRETKGDQADDLPPGGEWYDARIFTPTLGVMFFKPQELTDSLFLNTDQSIVDGLAERPVVAFIVEGSSARAAGVELGHVLLKVNGVDVRNPKEASRLIKEGPRPLPLLFYVPNTDVVVAEGEHMVKYDTRETTAPNSSKDWKPKYVVIGGIIAQPWMMNMYRSKSEYDIAVIETQARRPVSVKVKQFSLQGARIQNDWQGPQMVKYKNKIHPWKYIVVLPVARNPIKISSPNLAQLKPAHEGIRRVLLAQQRDRSYNPSSAAPVNNRNPQQNMHNAPYNNQGPQGGYHPQQQQQQQQQQQYQQQQQQLQQYNGHNRY